MKDRVPTRVINGAIRMAQYDENGDLVGYIYLKRADEPSEAGTPYSKNAVLTDATATAIGLTPASNPTPNDAFAKIAKRLSASDTAISQINGKVENPKTLTTLLDVTFSKRHSYSATLSISPFSFDRFLIVLDAYVEEGTNHYSIIQATYGATQIGSTALNYTSGYREGTQFGRIYFDNTHQIKLRSSGTGSHTIYSADTLEPILLENVDTRDGQTLTVSSDSRCYIKGITIYGENCALHC